MPVILCIITVLDLYGWNACDPLIILIYMAGMPVILL